MVSVLDSEAHFERKAKEAGITDPNVAVLKNRGFKTLSQVAHMVSQPTPEVATFCSTHFASFSIGEISSLRRLIFETGITVEGHLEPARSLLFNAATCIEAFYQSARQGFLR